MDIPHLDFNRLVDTALRGVVRQALLHAAEHGFAGEQQFLVDFRTDETGVEMPSWLREQYPEQIRIVLQHQFWNLEVGDDGFSVDLRFGGTPATLAVPFAAIEAFVDPSVPFGLSFQDNDEDDGDEPEAMPEPAAAQRDGDNVVAIDAFRKRSS